MDEVRITALLSALSLYAAGLIVRRMAEADGKSDTELAMEEARDAADLDDARRRVSSLLAASATSALASEWARRSRAIAESAERHGRSLPSATPSDVSGGADAMRLLLGREMSPSSIRIRTLDGAWVPFDDGWRSAVRAAASSPERDLQTLVDRAVRTLSKDGLAVQVGNQRPRDIVGAVRQSITDEIDRRADRACTEAGAMVGCDAFQISAHAQCADDHRRYQGRILTIEEYNRANRALDRPLAAGVMNCRHTKTPCFSDDRPVYSRSELARINATATKKVEYTLATGGKKRATVYQATQAQRRYEARVRNVRSQRYLARRGGLDTSAYDDQLRSLERGYDAFCAETGLDAQPDRLRVWTL